MLHWPCKLDAYKEQKKSIRSAAYLQTLKTQHRWKMDLVYICNKTIKALKDHTHIHLRTYVEYTAETAKRGALARAIKKRQIHRWRKRESLDKLVLVSTHNSFGSSEPPIIITTRRYYWLNWRLRWTTNKVYGSHTWLWLVHANPLCASATLIFVVLVTHRVPPSNHATKLFLLVYFIYGCDEYYVCTDKRKADYRFVSGNACVRWMNFYYSVLHFQMMGNYFLQNSHEKHACCFIQSSLVYSCVPNILTTWSCHLYFRLVYNFNSDIYINLE
jgi:hypothetical protein